jgi:peptidoglycan hydrolase CwlO-like protein
MKKNSIWGWVGVIVIGSLMFSIWNTDSKVNDINKKIDDLQSSVSAIQDNLGATTLNSDLNSQLTDIKTELDKLKYPGLNCISTYIGGNLTCALPY